MTTGFEAAGWGDADYDREYRDGSDVFIQQRATLLRVVASFYREFVADDRIALGEPARVLDLGCGDGILAEALCAQGGHVDVTLTDGSAAMLNAARERLSGQPISEFCQVTFEEIIDGAFRRPPFDIIVSSFAIHHLKTEQKAAMFHRLFDLHAPGGFFLNTDVVLADHAPYTEWYYTLWRDWIAARQCSLGLSDDFTGVPEEARGKDENRFDPLTVQLDALRRAGFEHVACHYRYGLFAIYGGQRPG